MTDKCPQRDQIQTLLGTSQDTECLLAFNNICPTLMPRVIQVKRHLGTVHELLLNPPLRSLFLELRLGEAWLGFRSFLFEPLYLSWRSLDVCAVVIWCLFLPSITDLRGWCLCLFVVMFVSLRGTL